MYRYIQVKRKNQANFEESCSKSLFILFLLPGNECLLLIVAIIVLIYSFHIFPNSLNPLQAKGTGARFVKAKLLLGASEALTLF